MSRPTFVELAANADAARVGGALAGLGLWVRGSATPEGLRGFEVDAASASVDAEVLRALPGVARVFCSESPHPLLDEQAGEPVLLERSALQIGAGAPPLLAAGPCAVESREQIEESAALVASAGGALLRGGAFKPRTSPYRFAGLGRRALGWLREAAERHGLGVVTEVMSEAEVDAVAEVADLVQVGARNMQNYALLRAVGAANLPVLLKRGLAATLSEWRLAAEHLLVAGAAGVVFCERGVRGSDPSTRNVLDLGAVALLAGVERQPVIADPSHALGRRDAIGPMAGAALAAGAHGLLLEVHPQPERARSDAAQALYPDQLAELVARLRRPAPLLPPSTRQLLETHS